MGSFVVSGAPGTIGSQVVKQLLAQHKGARITAISRDDTFQYMFRHHLGDPPSIRWVLADIRNTARVMQWIEPGDTFFHCAALKQVPVCEENCEEAEEINHIATRDLAQALVGPLNVKFVYVSTDKAVAPVSVLGVTKWRGELAVRLAGGVAVRLGNVISSRGSVFQLAAHQLRQHKAILITDPAMRRYWISAYEAAKACLRAVYAAPGEVLVPYHSMQELPLTDMLRRYFPSAAFKVIGTRIGEKLSEQLVWPEEQSRIKRRGKDWLIAPSEDMAQLYEEVTTNSGISPPHAEGQTESAQSARGV